MRVVERIDDYQRRHAWLGFPIAVVYKAVEDRVPYLAALLAYYAFVSLFPLFLLLFSSLGFFLEGHPGVREDIVNAALDEFPGIGSSLRENIEGFHGSAWAMTIGVLGTLYGGLGMMQAAQTGFNQIYAVPRHRQPNPIKGRLRGLGLLALLGVGLLLTAAATSLSVHSFETPAGVDGALRVVIYVAGVLVSVALFTAAYQLLTATELKVRDVVIGGVLTATVWQVLQVVGGPYVSHRAQSAGALYGTFSVVLATLAWIYLQALALMVSAEVNIVFSRRLWPRALLTPFTDAVELTDADRRVYAAHASAAAFKGFETVSVKFRD